MAEWEGWSTDQQQVDVTRVLAVLFASLGTDSQTRKSTADALAELQIADVQADELAVRLVELGLFRADSLSMAPAQDTLLVSKKGRRVEAEFRQAVTGRRMVGPQARRALLLWRFDINVDWPHSSEMLTAPHAWFYGRRFSAEALAEAADNLVERGYLEATKQSFGRVGGRIQLTATGMACVEKFDGDPDAIEAALRNSQNISIGSYHQQGGNNAFGSTVGSQHAGATDPPIWHPAADLATILQIINVAGDVPKQFVAAISEAQVALIAGNDPRSAVEQTRQLVADLTGTASLNPAAQALLTAAADYTVQRLALRPDRTVSG